MNISGPSPSAPVRVRYQYEIYIGPSCTSVIRQLGGLPPDADIKPYVQAVQRRCEQLYGKAPRPEPMLFLQDLHKLKEIKIYSITDGRLKGEV